MSYSLNRFLRPLKDTDKTIRIFDDRNYPVHTINPFSVLRLYVTNSNLNIALSGNRTITLDFIALDETKEALFKLQSFIDILRQKSPDVVDKETEKYIEKVVQIASAGGLSSLNGVTASNQSLIVEGDKNLDMKIENNGSTHSISLSWTGILPIEKGGLNNTKFNNGELLISSSDSIVSSGYTINDVGDSNSDIWTAKKIIEELYRDPFSYKEEPIGYVDGVNSVFLLKEDPIEFSEHIFLNGLLQNEKIDYSISGKEITFFYAPPKDSLILCTYKKVLKFEKKIV
jgi:hypothetical protein